MGVLERFSQQGNIALVTGGSGPQFGSSISRGLAEAGATVISASRNLATNQEFVEELRRRSFDAHAMRFDQSDPDSIQELHDTINHQFGKLDILVNSSTARDGHRGCLEAQTAEDYLKCAQVDFIGLLHICRLFLADMVHQRRGTIINIASIYGVVANDPTLYEDTTMVQPPTYCFTKAGIINYTRYLANYYGKYGVRANCVSPGGYLANQPGVFIERYAHRVPLGRMMNEEDVQGAVVFLASDAAAYITGHNLIVDGGWTTK